VNDPHNSTGKLEKTVRLLLEDSDVPEASKKLILDFQTACFAEGLSPARVEICVRNLRLIAKALGRKALDKATKQDIVKVLNWVEKQPYTKWTKQTFRVVLRKFYRWLGREELVSWVKTTIRGNEMRVLPEQVLTPEDVEKVIEVARTSMQKALIATLYDTGCRVGELLKLKIGSVRFDQYGVQIIVEGKTGPRRVRGILCTSALKSWLEQHPLKDNPEAPLWLAKNMNPLSWNAVRKLVKRLAKKAGINKPVHPHAFRHARATFLASKLTEAQLKEYFGWTQSSRMASVYVHLSGRDVDKALLKAHGIEVEEEKPRKIELTKTCPRCGEVASASARFCPRCGLALDLKAVMEVEEARSVGDQILTEPLQDQEVLQLLVKKLSEKDLGEKLLKIFKK
jgi:site-specific recombinase XerD